MIALLQETVNLPVAESLPDVLLLLPVAESAHVTGHRVHRVVLIVRKVRLNPKAHLGNQQLILIQEAVWTAVKNHHVRSPELGKYAYLHSA